MDERNGYIEVFQRMEVKYLLTAKQYQSLVDFLADYAKIDEYGKTGIHNLYFDTEDYRLIRASLDKPVYKEKLRLRTYGQAHDLTDSFIEIKKKYDGIVYKRRVAGSYRKAYEYLVKGQRPLDDSQISKEIEAFRQTYHNPKPAMYIGYDRIAMAGTHDPGLRITFDTNIRWSREIRDLRNMSGQCKNLIKEEEVLMEIKILNAMPMYLAKELSRLQIFPTTFSKYGKGYLAMLKESSVPAAVPAYEPSKEYLSAKRTFTSPQREVEKYA